jgi:hypothetical protein
MRTGLMACAMLRYGSMKAPWTFAVLMLVSAIVSATRIGPMAVELWAILAMACLALCLATLLAQLMGAPPIQWRHDPTKIALSVGAAVVMLPFAAIVAIMSLVFALPMLIAGLFCCPPLVWREHWLAEDNADRSLHARSTLHPQHA